MARLSEKGFSSLEEALDFVGKIRKQVEKDPEYEFYFDLKKKLKDSEDSLRSVAEIFHSINENKKQ